MSEIPASLSAETAALRRLAGLSHGTPAFAFAVCNRPALRHDLIAALLPDTGAAVAALPANTADPVVAALALIPSGHAGPVFVTGLDVLLSEASADAAAFAGRLNRSRERWRQVFPAHLLVFWVSGQALVRIFQDAPDFRAWFSHELDFTEESALAPAPAAVPRTTATPLAPAEAARRAEALAARLTASDDLPPLQRLAVVSELLRLAPAGAEVGDLVETSIGEALQLIRQRAAAKPQNSSAQRDLSLALDHVAGARLEMGQSSAALRLYQEAKAIDERLVASDPANAEWQRDLSVTLASLGDVAVAQGDLASAFHCFTEQNAISKRLVASDTANTEWQRDLSVSLNKLSNLALARGDTDGALSYLTESQTIRERLAASDPANASWQRDLSVTLNKLGDLAVDRGDLIEALRNYTLSKTSAEHLAASDRANAVWQHDLSVSLEKLGDLAVTQGDLARAMQWRTESQTLRERLAFTDPANAVWQRDLAVSLHKLGDLVVAQGDLDGAMRRFTECQAILKRLAKSDPSSAALQRDLSYNYYLMAAKIFIPRENWREALALMERSLEIDELLAASDRTNVIWQQDERVSRRLVAELRAKVGGA